MDDPDAPDGTWAHWLLVDVPAATTSLAANADATGLPSGTRRGVTSGDQTGYEGPWPPSGQVHTYRITVYALNAATLSIDLSRTWTRAQFSAAFASAILGSGTLACTVTGPAG
jgi:Raf kinase inhibitor-like YbhB/YbcL family protein